MRWIIGVCVFGIGLIIGIGLFQIVQIKQDQQFLEREQVTASMSSAEQHLLKSELLQLQEENARLRASLIEANQKIASLSIKSKSKPAVVSLPPSQPNISTSFASSIGQTATIQNSASSKGPAALTAKKPAEKEKPKVQKVAEVKKKKKPQKVIQVSFDEADLVQ